MTGPVGAWAQAPPSPPLLTPLRVGNCQSNQGVLRCLKVDDEAHFYNNNNGLNPKVKSFDETTRRPGYFASPPDSLHRLGISNLIKKNLFVVKFLDYKRSISVM